MTKTVHIPSEVLSYYVGRNPITTADALLRMYKYMRFCGFCRDVNTEMKCNDVMVRF